jgi:hypothetical protein
MHGIKDRGHKSYLITDTQVSVPGSENGAQRSPDNYD